MPESETETLIEEMRSRIGALKGRAHADILSVSFDTIGQIEALGEDLFMLARKLKTARGVELEKWFIAAKSSQ